MVSKLDQSVGAVVGALGRKNMLKNSVIVFASDNGPSNIGSYKNWGSCYPFRGVSIIHFTYTFNQWRIQGGGPGGRPPPRIFLL